MQVHHAAKTKMTHTERTDLVLSLTLQGCSTKELRAALGGVTKQRISQLHKALIRDGKLTKEQLPSAQKRQKRRIEYINKWGHPREECALRQSDLYRAMREKFRSKKARSFAYEFTISFGELSFPTHCPVLGIELDYFAEGTQENSVSFDRTDPSKGYISGNVRIISWRANRIKNDGTAEEHEKIAKYMREQLSNGV